MHGELSWAELSGWLRCGQRPQCVHAAACCFLKRRPGPASACRLDFDEDLPPLDVPALVQRIAQLAQRVDATLATARQGQLLRAGLQVGWVAVGAGTHAGRSVGWCSYCRRNACYA